MAYSKTNNRKQAFQLWRTIGIFLALVFFAAKIITADEDQCEQEISQRGFALLNYTYRSLSCADYPCCVKKCNADIRCMSFNYWWYRSQCDLNNRTKYSAAPRSLICDQSSTYMGMLPESVKKTVYRSCNDVHPSCGDGEYSIDPTSSGDPFTVYCDMTTDGGGWTLVYKSVLQSSTPPNSHIKATHYRNLSKYKLNNQLVPSPVLLQLRQDMGYTQLRIYCHKKQVGTVFHIMTNNDNSGEAVVKFFTDNAYKAARPQACGSFTMLPDDNSSLSRGCDRWGLDKPDLDADGKWGMNTREHDFRLYQTPMIMHSGHHTVWLYLKFVCDDYPGRAALHKPLSSGDTWVIYVR